MFCLVINYLHLKLYLCISQGKLPTGNFNNHRQIFAILKVLLQTMVSTSYTSPYIPSEKPYKEWWNISNTSENPLSAGDTGWG